MIVCDVMDGAGVTSGAAGGSDETVMMQQASQDDIFQSQYFTGNRFQTLSEGVGYPMNGGRSSSRSNKQQVTRGQQDQPISGAQPAHMIHDVSTGVPMNEHSNITTSQVTDNTQDSTQK